MEAAVEHVILSMHDRYFEPLTVSELASEVFVSPFHFSRMFARATGVTPGRYLTAVRLFEAKRLLLTTPLTVSDVVCSVGYSSVGTFTARFTHAVGMTPAQYRRPEVERSFVAFAPQLQRLPSLDVLRNAERGCALRQGHGGSIIGRIVMPVGSTPANVLVGVFTDAIPQRGPLALKGLRDAGSTELILDGVPEGRWALLAVARHQAAPGLPATFSIGSAGQPVSVSPGRITWASVRMRGLLPTDPPIAFTLAEQCFPAVARRYLTRGGQLSAAA